MSAIAQLAAPSVPDSKAEAAPRLLGEFLRRLRLERGLSLAEVAPVIRGSVSKMSRLERGESPPKERDAYDLVRHYGPRADQMDEFENLMRQVQDSARYKTYSDVTPGYLRRLIALEKAAITILAYETHVVPGLLQTPSYARAVIRTAMPEGDEAEIDRHVRARIDRQSLFHSDHRPEVLALLDEGVLRRPVGGPEVMCEQITFLRTAMATEARVNILIVPFDRAAIAPNYPITHLHFGDGGPSELVYVEQMNKADYWTRPAYLDQYRLVITKLMDVALSREETIDFLNDMHGQYEAQMRRG